MEGRQSRWFAVSGASMGVSGGSRWCARVGGWDRPCVCGPCPAPAWPKGGSVTPRPEPPLVQARARAAPDARGSLCSVELHRCSDAQVIVATGRPARRRGPQPRVLCEEEHATRGKLRRRCRGQARSAGYALPVSAAFRCRPGATARRPAGRAKP